MGLQESWYEKLNRWEEALEAYERKYHSAVGSPTHIDAALGRLRFTMHCLNPSLSRLRSICYLHGQEAMFVLTCLVAMWLVL